MRFRRMALSAAVAALLAMLPLAHAKAQYYAPCSPFPLFWPFCVAGAVVGGAVAVATAPVRAVFGPPYYYGPPYAYPGPAYAYPGPPYPGWRYRLWCRNHPYRCRW